MKLQRLIIGSVAIVFMSGLLPSSHAQLSSDLELITSSSVGYEMSTRRSVARGLNSFYVLATESDYSSTTQGGSRQIWFDGSGGYSRSLDPWTPGFKNFAVAGGINLPNGQTDLGGGNVNGLAVYVSGKDLCGVVRTEYAGPEPPIYTIDTAEPSEDIYSPAVAYLGQGWYLVVWAKGQILNGASSTCNLRARTFYLGTKGWSSPTTLKSASSTCFWAPSLATITPKVNSSDTPKVVLVYQKAYASSSALDDWDWDIEATILEGLSVKSTTLVASSTSPETQPQVAYSPVQNRAVIVWERRFSGGDHDIYSRNYAVGSSNLSPIDSAESILNSSRKEYMPSIAYDHVNDQYGLVYVMNYDADGTDPDVKMVRLETINGHIISGSDENIAASSVFESQPSVAFASDGGVGVFQIVWQEKYGGRGEIWGRQYRTEHMRPPNDNFASAILMPGAGGQITGANVNATKESGEPTHAGHSGGASVWWKWTAPASGQVTINTFGSDFDTLLAVYTGTSVDNLMEKAANDDSGGEIQSQVQFIATAGTTYRIAVDGYAAATGSITLNWDLSPNSLLVSSEFFELPPGGGSDIFDITANVNWTVTSVVGWPSGDATWPTVSPTSGSNNGRVTVSATANRTGSRRCAEVTITGGGITRNVIVCQPSESNLADAVDSPSLEWTSGGNADWFGQTVMTHDGEDAAQSGAITHNQSSWMQTTVTGPGGLRFWWKVSSEANWDILRFYLDETSKDAISGTIDWEQKWYEIPSGTHTLKWIYSKDSSASAGSDCGWVDQVQWVPGIEGIQSVADIVPTSWNVTGPNTVSGRFDITLRNRDNPTACQAVVVGLRDSAGNWVSGTEPAVVLTDVPSSSSSGQFYNDVSFAIPTKSVTSAQTWGIWVGDTYTVTDTQAIDAFKSMTPSGNDSKNHLLGNITVNPSSVPPPNDNFANAITISGSGGQVTGTNVDATKESGEPNHAGRSGGASVWWKWTAPANGQVKIDTFGSNFDTVLAIYTGTSVGNLTEKASNDDAGAGTQSQVQFNATAGTMYVIAVDGYSAATGSITLNWDLSPPVLSINPTSTNVPASASSGHQVAVTANVSWTAARGAGDTWITITGGSSGSTNGTVTFSVAANTGSARSGTIVVSGGGLSRTFTVNQAAAAASVLSINPTSTNVPAAASSGHQIAVTANVSWTAARGANDTWITITGGSSGSTNGTVTYSVAANTGPARSGSIVVSGGGLSRTFTISQAGAGSALPGRGGMLRILSSGPTCFMDFKSDGLVVWSNSIVGSTGRIQISSSVTPAWTDVHTFTATERIMSTQLGSSGEGGGHQTYMVVDLSGGPEAESYPVSYLNAVPAGGWTDEYKTTKLVLRRIPAGTFTMGSSVDELGRYSDETQHQVTLTKDFYIGVFEVTQKQWERVMGDWPSWFTNTTYRETRPVERVSYYEIRENPANSAISPNWPQSSQVHAESFMGRLRAKTGLATFDLPTEAQWEYACRAGTTTALNSGKNLTGTTSCPNMAEVGRYYDNHPGGYSSSSSVSTDGGTAKVGSYLPNAWGLYDMHGNVWERCLDWYEGYGGTQSDPSGADSGSLRVERGGSWFSNARSCRSAYRSSLAPDDRYYSLGFRLSRTLPSETTLSAPTPIEPSGLASSSMPLFRWTGVQGATGYQLVFGVHWLDTDWNYWASTSNVENVTQKGNYGFFAADYRWKLRATNSTSTSAWSDWLYFTIPGDDTPW